MFRCEVESCKELTLPRQPVNRIITETRPKHYRSKVVKEEENGKQHIYWVESDGHEIVKQIAACPKCYRTLTGKQPLLASDNQSVILDRREARKPFPFPNQKKWRNPRKGKSSPGEKMKLGKQEQVQQKVEERVVLVEVVNPLPLEK